MQVSLEAAKRSLAEAETEYHVSVQTSDVKFAGTDADVTVELQGHRDGNMVTTGKLPLSSSRNDFERGRLDHFAVTCAPLTSLLSTLGPTSDVGTFTLDLHVGAHLRRWHLHVELECLLGV